jgi:glycosyltransferase involved in cell wall biosynthesis
VSPELSIVIPVRNGERYLAAAIESALAEGPEGSSEVIVVDDGSTDASPEIASSFGAPVRSMTSAGRGQGMARNAGVAAARGELLGFLDADDIWTPGRFERQRAVLERGDVELIFGHSRRFVSPELEPEQAVRFDASGGPVPATQVTTLLIRRRDFERVGPFSDDPNGEMMDWLFRARELGLRERILEDVVLERRLHPWSHTVATQERVGRSYAQILKRALDRRRASTGADVE